MHCLASTTQLCDFTLLLTPPGPTPAPTCLHAAIEVWDNRNICSKREGDVIVGFMVQGF